MCAAGGTAPGGDTATTGPTKDTEHALALKIGLKLEALFSANSDKAVLTRKSAVCPSLQERVEIANNAKTNVFLSIHFNGVTDPKANGTQAWYLAKKLSSSQLAPLNENAIVASLGTANRGIKRSGQDEKFLN